MKTFIDIYKKIMGEREDTAFVLAGDGPIRGELEAAMPEAVFLGYQKSRDLANIYATSDIFLFPSTTETFGNVVLEGMACGLPALCAKEGGAYSSVRENNTGFICRPGDASHFSEKLNPLLDDDTLLKSLSKNSLEYAQQQTWENIFKKQYKIYEEIISSFRRKNTPKKAA